MGIGRAVIGLRVHLGWAASVALGGTRDAPVVLDRRRLALWDPERGGTHEPYHEARECSLAHARALVARETRAIRTATRRSLRAVVDELRATGHEVVGSGLLLASGRPPDTLESALSSHARVHMAEAAMYRDALARASDSLDAPVLGIPERELFARAEAALGLRVPALKKRLAALGEPVGSPWRQDEKLSALAAWLALRAR